VTSAEPIDLGVHLRRTGEAIDEIATFAARTGGPAGIEGLLTDLNRQGKSSRGWFGGAVREAYTWDPEDRATREWYPQGITTAAFADPAPSGDVLAMTWYAKARDGLNRGSRISFFDLDTLRYRHVLLVVPKKVPLAGGGSRPTWEPLRIHAGGIVWAGPYLHVAATARGFFTFRVDDILHLPDGFGRPDPWRLGFSDTDLSAFGYRYVLPARFAYRAETVAGVPKLRYSNLSLDLASDPKTLITGEYGRRGQTTRVAHFPLHPETLLPDTATSERSFPTDVTDGALNQMQGITRVEGTYYASVSRGPLWPGSVYVGTPGSFTGRHLATPMGPEDISYDPATDRLWSLSEYPLLRWIYSMDRARLTQ
jgi:hypothetical protein